MPAPEDVLADLAAHPPVAPTPIAEIRGRARRRTRRRRALGGGAAALVLVAVGAALGAAVTADDPGEGVAAGGGDPATTGGPTGPSTSFEPTLTLDPATGHETGTRVRVTVPGSPVIGPAVVTLCASEALTAAPDDVLSWCVEQWPVTSLPDDASVLVQGSVVTPDGVVACDDEPGRCVVVVAAGEPRGAELRWAPLDVDGTPPASDERGVVVDGDEGTVGDGDTLLITLTGVATGERIFIQQCTEQRCDDVRARATAVEDGPETQLTFTAFHDVYVDRATGMDAYAPGWVACEPCDVVIWVGDEQYRRPLAMEPTAAPIRPSIALEPEGPYRWGEGVTVRAAGLQPSDMVPIGWCPTTVPQGGGASGCWSGVAELPIEYPVGADGTVVVEGFALPQPDSYVGDDCAVAGACGVGLDGGDPSAILAIVPLDMGG